MGSCTSCYRDEGVDIPQECELYGERVKQTHKKKKDGWCCKTRYNIYNFRCCKERDYT